MGHLTLVRHGQASVQGATYDALSPLGHVQSRQLGEHWADQGIAFDTVFIGPRRRHAQTAACVADAYRARGLPWPEPLQLPALDEHDGLAVLKHAAGIHEPGDGLLSGDTSRDAAIKHLFGQYREIMTSWAAGNYRADGIEPWSAFRVRAQRAVDQLRQTPGQSIAFTSGGLIAAVVGSVLDLDDRRVIELSATIYNTGVTELRHRPDDVGLVTFNGIAHLRDAASITRV